MRKRSFSTSAERGFTLLEALLALVILSLLLTTVYGAVSRTLTSKGIGEDRAELFAAGRDAVLRIADDIEGALLPAAGGEYNFIFKGIPSGGQPPADTIQFSAVNRGGYGARRVCPGPALVTYGLQQFGDRSDSLVLFRDEFSWADLVAEAKGITPEMESEIDQLLDEEEEIPCEKQDSRPLLYCEDPSAAASLPGSCIRVVGLSFRYYDKAGGDFREEWDSTQPEETDTGGRLPAAVQIALYLADERGRIQEFTTIADVPLGRDQPVTPRAEDRDEDDPNGNGGTGGSGDPNDDGGDDDD